MEDNDETKTCAQCRRTLDPGVDVLTVEQGVIGPRGLVPLGELGFFCDETCLRRYYGNDEIEQLKRRIP